MSDSPEQTARYKSYLETATDKGDTTRWRYVDEVGRFASWAEGRSLNGLHPADIIAWNAMLYDGGGAQETIGQKRAAVRSFLEYLQNFEGDAHAADLLRAMNKLTKPPSSQPRRETFALTAAQFQKMLSAADERPVVGARDRALVHFLWSTGNRRAEVYDLALPLVALEERLATVVGKRAKSRAVVFDAAFQQHLALSRRFLSTEGALFARRFFPQGRCRSLLSSSRWAV